MPSFDLYSHRHGTCLPTDAGGTCRPPDHSRTYSPCSDGDRVISAVADRPDDDPALTARLTEEWETPDNWLARLTTVDHKTLGTRYIITAFVFFILAGIEALLMRTQLARPELRLLSPEAYNQLFTMHGTTMMFLFIQPVLSGYSFYLTPLMIGARELAFPRLNTFSYYAFLLSGVFMYASFFIGQAPDGGWFNYTPLTSTPYDLGYNIDFYALGLLFLTISTTAGAFNSIVTILKLRAPGMAISRMPLFLWSSLTTSVSIVFAMPALSVALVFLELERRWNFAFFDPRFGGSPFLWQHLFWIFGHPWVYIVFLPAMGMLSMVIPTFSRRPIVGHNLVALSTVSTGLLGFGVWVHHMFATGIPQLSLTFFSAGSMAVSVPSGIQIIAWIATMWYGRTVLQTPMLFAIGFIVQFVIGGITGVMTALIPFDWQAHDTYFVVGHIHYVLAGGSVFALLAGVFYWFPKMTGRMFNERLGKWSFWLMFTGFNLTFFPMHISGLIGMARRVYTYLPGLGLELPNLLSTIGAFVFALGFLLVLWNILVSRRSGEIAGRDPWGANTLEWATESPPEPFNFAHPPVVTSRDPLWDGGYSEGPAYDQGRLTPMTSALDGELQKVIELPEGNVWTLIISLSLLGIVTGVLMKWEPLAIICGLVTLISIARWAWPRQRMVLETEV